MQWGETGQRTVFVNAANTPEGKVKPGIGMRRMCGGAGFRPIIVDLRDEGDGRRPTDVEVPASI